MLTPDELLWTEIGASLCWMVVSGLFALYWINRPRMGTRGFSAMPLVVFGGVFTPIAALLTAHAMAGKVLTTSGGVPLWTFFFPMVCLAVAAGALLAWISMRAQVRAAGADAPHSPASAMPIMLAGSGLFAVVGVLFFWMLVAIQHDPEKCEAVFRKDHAQSRI